MKCTDYEKLAVGILRKSYIGTVATTSVDGQPWNTPVVMECDSRLQLYWFSDQASQHARNVRENGRAFIVLYDSTVTSGQGRRTGLYIRTSARELHDIQEIRRACTLRKPNNLDYPRSFIGKAVRRVYQATPEQLWINEEQIEAGVFIRDYRVELSLFAVQLELSAEMTRPD